MSGVGHGAANGAYGTQHMWDWMLAQRRQTNRPALSTVTAFVGGVEKTSLPIAGNSQIVFRVKATSTAGIKEVRANMWGLFCSDKYVLVPVGGEEYEAICNYQYSSYIPSGDRNIYITAIDNNGKRVTQLKVINLIP
jgi:hypothetical protein